MNIDLTCKNLYWEVDDAASDFNDYDKMNFSEINSGVEELIVGAESCLKMISDRRKLTDEQFYEMLLKFADINDLNEYDCYCILELVHNLKFVDDAVIKTTMHANIQKTEGHGRDFSWWNEKIGINFKILYTEDFKVDYEHVYNIEEIKRFIDEKKIIIICEEERSLDCNKRTYEEEGYERFDYAYYDYNMEYEFFDKSGKFYPYMLKYIKRQINKKKLLKLFKEHLQHANREIYDVTHTNCWTREQSQKVVEEYSSEFENQGYAKRLNKLNEFNKKIRF